MSRAHFAHKNIDWPNMLKLLCYNTEKPELLSKKQQVTRLYKSCLRTSFDRVYRGTFGESRHYFREQTNIRRVEFNNMLQLDRNSKEYQEHICVYENYIDENYDVTMLLFDNQAHSLNSQKLTIYSDEVC